MRTNIVVFSHHRRKCWNNCRLQQYLKYECKLSKPKETNMDILFGQAMHKALELYYSQYRKIDDSDVIQEFSNWLQEYDSNYIDIMTVETIENIGTILLNQYLSADRASNQEIVAIEEPFMIGICGTDDITDNLDDKDIILYYSGKIDLALRINNKIYFLDFKTTGMNKDNFINFMSNDEQLLGYAVYGNFKYGKQFGGVCYNGFLKQLPKNEPHIFRKFIAYSEDERNILINTLIADATEYYSFKPYESLFTKAMTDPMKCSRCEFLEPCSYKRKGRNYEEILDRLYTTYEKYDWEQ